MLKQIKIAFNDPAAEPSEVSDDELEVIRKYDCQWYSQWYNDTEKYDKEDKNKESKEENEESKESKEESEKSETENVDGKAYEKKKL